MMGLGFVALTDSMTSESGAPVLAILAVRLSLHYLSLPLCCLKLMFARQIYEIKLIICGCEWIKVLNMFTTAKA